MSNPTIGFIGYGNMAQAIAEGLVAAGAVDGADIVACAEWSPAIRSFRCAA